MNRRSSISATLSGRLRCEMTTATHRRSANLRPPGYEHYDSRPRRLTPSPLTHTVPSQRIHSCLDVSPVPRCPGYTFGYTLPTTAALPLKNVVVVPSFAVLRWLHIDRPPDHTRSGPVRTAAGRRR